MKDAYYFFHDGNARNDIKIKALIRKHGLVAYAKYWIIIEMLREQDDYKLPFDDLAFEALANEFNERSTDVQLMLNDCIDTFKLFEKDDQFFWSESLLKRMEIKDKKKEQASRAGKKSAEKRRKNKEESTEESTDVEQTLNGRSTDVEQRKKQTNKETKKLNKQTKEVVNLKNDSIDLNLIVNSFDLKDNLLDKEELLLFFNKKFKYNMKLCFLEKIIDNYSIERVRNFIINMDTIEDMQKKYPNKENNPIKFLLSGLKNNYALKEN